MSTLSLNTFPLSIWNAAEAFKLAIRGFYVAKLI